MSKDERFATDTTPSRATEAAQIYADFHGEDASYRPECAAKLAALGAPSRDEEGSVDREAVARIIAPSMWESEAESALITFGRVVSLRKADAILALKTSTPETQTVECDCAARYYGDDRGAHQLSCAKATTTPERAIVLEEAARKVVLAYDEAEEAGGNYLWDECSRRVEELRDALSASPIEVEK